MKKIILALVAFMLVLGMTQCKKEQQPNNTATADGETVYITMKVADNGGKHVVYPGTGAVVYGNGDKIYVGNNGKYVGTLTYANGTFSGSITNPSTSDYLHFYFTGGKTPATNPTAGSTTSFTVSIADQSSKLPVLSYGHSTSKYIDGTTAYTCMLENQCGLVKFVPATATSNPISVSGMKTTATIDFATPGITPTEATGSVTLYSVSGSEKWAILLPQNEVAFQIVNNMDGFWRINDIPAVTANMYYNAGIGMTFSEGPFNAINSLFTINANGDQVYFSDGNLQYNASWGEPYWGFASQQWEYLGPTGQNSSKENVDRDLFGWGTSGYNHGAVCYQPWSTSLTSSDYYAYGSSSCNLFDQTGQADWGYNIINNYSENGEWRTLTRDEWEYLINTRSTDSDIRYAKAKVNDVNGVILLPDNWDPLCYTLNSTNTSNAAFSTNEITNADWYYILQAAGAVFLPAAGVRNETSVYSGGSQGYYWSASKLGTDSAWTVIITDSEFRTNFSRGLGYGQSVRLVRDVN